MAAQGQAVPDQGLSPFCSDPERGILPTCMSLMPACSSTFCPLPVLQAATLWPLAALGTLDQENRPLWALEAGLDHLGRESGVLDTRNKV